MRKPVYELVPADLIAHPIWEFALADEGVEGQDETTVRPCLDCEVADPASGMTVVRATFTAADGTQYTGYYTPWWDNDLGSTQPTVVTDAGQVTFWYGLATPDPAQIRTSLEILGKEAESLFPITFEADVPSRGHQPHGVIPSFTRLGKDQ